MIQRHADPVAYERLVTPLLLADEPRYNLELGLVGRLAGGETFGDEPAVLLTIGDGPEGMALMTPPYNLLLAAVPPAAAADLAEYLAGHDVPVPGAMGDADTVDTFAARYTTLTGSIARVTRRSGVYALTTVIPARPTTGALRQAEEADLGLVDSWWLAFRAEIEDAVGSDTMARQVRGGMAWLWEDDGRPVSLVGCGAYTPNGARIGPVYTPPELRGRGYASAATAAVTQLLLDRGLASTFLYTDLANPTSNKIYRAIGYEHVTDVHVIAFDR